MRYFILISTLFVLVCVVSSHRPHPEAIAAQLSVGKVAALSHHIAKRQISPTLLQDLLDCTTTIINYQCGSSGYAQEIVNIALGCRNDTYARHAANSCARSENGDFCGSAILRFSVDQSLVVGASSCSSAVTSGSCSSTCRSFLESARSRLGCCINTLINTTGSPLLATYGTYVNNRLWNLCNVPLPASDCGNGLPLNPPQDVQSCTQQELLSRFANYECMTSVGQPLVDALLRRNSRCYIYARSLVDICATDANNQYCAVTIGSDIITSGASSDPLYLSLITNCASTSSSFCSSSCRNAITNIANNYGCCVNVYNSSAYQSLGLQLPQLSYGVWNSCGVNSPGFCTGTSTLSGAATMNAFVWIIAIAMTIYVGLCI